MADTATNDMLSAFEQVETVSEKVARVVAGYYEALRKDGMDLMTACRLTESLQAELFRATIFKSTAPPPDDHA